MHVTMALIFRHILNFQPENSPRLPASPKQRLAADLVRLVAEPRESWSFHLPRAQDWQQPWATSCLWAAIRYFYTGQITRLGMAGVRPPKSGTPGWK